MSESKFYAIHCDEPRCYVTVMGEAYETPGKVRRRLVRQGWTAVYEPSGYDDKLERHRGDLCPQHSTDRTSKYVGLRRAKR